MVGPRGRTLGTAYAQRESMIAHALTSPRLDRCAVLVILAATLAGACSAYTRVAGWRPDDASTALATRPTGDGRPPLTVIAREGDARGALAIAVTTEGIASERGALAGVALAALVQERLSIRGVEASAVGGWTGWRLRALVASPADAERVLDATRAALLVPVSANEPALGAVLRKAAALSARPLIDAAWVDVAQCTGDAFGSGAEALPTPAELESWRAASHGLGRLAIATAGGVELADAATRALERGPPWPVGAPLLPSSWPAATAAAVVYDGSGELAPGAARIIVTARTATPERAVAAASLLGAAHGPLASRLEALEAPAHLRSVVATAHTDGGCLAATIDMAEHDLGADGPSRIATAAALARQELAVEVADITAPAGLGRALSLRAADPRDAAERAAWWSLAGHRPGVAEGDVRVNLVVGVAASRDASQAAMRSRTDSIRAELDRATLAWHASVVESRTRVERGQGEVWVLLASPCGTMSEDNGDAGASAAVAWAAATQGEDLASNARVEPFVAPDGVGVMVHGPSRAGETADAHARRLADMAARAFAADSLERQPLSRARTALLLRASRADAWTAGMLAGALAPAHPSWVEAFGTVFGLSSVSDETLALRAADMRAGPLRVAVLANVDTAQADAAVRAVDRWIARLPSDSRVCPPVGPANTPRAGTYAVERVVGAPSEALIAIPLPSGDPGAATAAAWLAAVLDGADGSLARALNADGADRHGPAAGPLAETWSASVLPSPQAPALVIRLTAADALLDAAVAQARALLDRLRQGAIREDDRARAGNRIVRAALEASLQPRARTISLWRGESPTSPPSLQALRTFAASALHDDALVIVAARPPRVDPAVHAQPSREPKFKSRE